MVISKKTIIFQGFRGGGGGNIFQTESSFFQGGLNANFYRNP